MIKHTAYPKWKYAKPASSIDAPRSQIVANEAQEAALGDEWYDTPNYTNNDPVEVAQASESAIPAGYMPIEYPKWLYSQSIVGGRLVHNQGEVDDLHAAYPDAEWSDTPVNEAAAVQMRAFGAPEDTGLDPNDPLAASDPVRLQSDNRLPANAEQASQVPSGVQSAVAANSANVKAEGEDKAAKVGDNVDEDTEGDNVDEDTEGDNVDEGGTADAADVTSEKAAAENTKLTPAEKAKATRAANAAKKTTSATGGEDLL